MKSLVRRVAKAAAGALASGPRPITHFAITSVSPVSRVALSYAFVRGTGIEIGALHNPLRLPPGAKARYVDRMSRSELYAHYPELCGQPLVEVDIIDDGETLGTIGNDSQDFVIANHFLEHCEDPIGTIKTFARVLSPGGVMFLAIPDMRFTFDCDRQRTTLEHLIADHRNGPAGTRSEHYQEWSRLVEPHFNQVIESDISQRAADLERSRYSIHFHVWTPDDTDALFAHCIESERVPLRMEFSGSFPDNGEMIFVLTKLERQP